MMGMIGWCSVDELDDIVNALDVAEFQHTVRYRRRWAGSEGLLEMTEPV